MEAIQDVPVRIAAFREAAVPSLARIRRKILTQGKAEKPPEYFVYPQGACRIRKSAKPPTAAQYCKAFLLKL
ncbi:MAG: hypothetical protein U0M25_08085 [Oscillospiraceae bacterium]|nr:hypothetical protein [Oscillospiraceae bacterium]